MVALTQYMFGDLSLVERRYATGSGAILSLSALAILSELRATFPNLLMEE